MQNQYKYFTLAGAHASQTADARKIYILHIYIINILYFIVIL